MSKYWSAIPDRGFCREGKRSVMGPFKTEDEAIEACFIANPDEEKCMTWIVSYPGQRVQFYRTWKRESH